MNNAANRIALTHLIAKASTTGNVSDVLTEANVIALVNGGHFTAGDLSYITPTIEACIKGTNSPSQAFKNIGLQLEYFDAENARGTAILSQVTFWLYNAIESARCW